MHDKPIYFEGKKFSDLFEAVDPDYRRGDKDRDLHHARRFRYMNVSGYELDREKWGGFAVKPTVELSNFLCDEMWSIVPGDAIYFECVFRTDGTVLICARYNSIIGSRWLTITTPDDIPTKNKLQATKIVEEAQKWTDRKKAEGWTKEDFANEMKSFLNGGA